MVTFVIFLGFKVARSPKGLSPSQRKYLIDLLTKSGMLGFQPIDTPRDLVFRFDENLGNALEALGRYHRLIGKLIYLTVTRHDITFIVGLLSRYMQTPHQLHWNAACRLM